MKFIKKFAARTFACFAVGLLAVGCSSSATEEPLAPVEPDDAPVEIVLNGGISLPAADGIACAALASDVSAPATRAAVNVEHDALPISILRRDQSGTPLAYPDYKDGELLKAELGESSSTNFVSGITFDVTQYYLPDAAKKTKLIGWHPQVSESRATDVQFSTIDGTVSFKIDGASDIMLSTEVEGGKDDKFTADADKQLKFSHLLTQVQIKAYAADKAAKDKWGKIKSIKLQGEGGKTCKVTLNENDASSESFVAPATAADLTLAQETVGEVELGVGKENAKECGYAMFQPVAAGAATPLTLLVETENGGTQTVEIASDKVASFDKGKAYKLTLKITITGADPNGQITKWEDRTWGTSPGDFDGEIEL